MKLVTMVYQNVSIKGLDDWLSWDTSDADASNMLDEEEDKKKEEATFMT